MPRQPHHPRVPRASCADNPETEVQTKGGIESLAARWRRRAAMLRRWGIADAGQLVHALSDELEAEIARWMDEEMSPAEWAASGEVGLSADWIAKLVSRGELPNRGRLNAPRIRRRDLLRYCMKLPIDESSGVVIDNTPSASESLDAYGDRAVLTKSSTRR